MLIIRPQIIQFNDTGHKPLHECDGERCRQGSDREAGRDCKHNARVKLRNDYSIAFGFCGIIMHEKDLRCRKLGTRAT
jgi:hypothetical protein